MNKKLQILITERFALTTLVQMQTNEQLHVIQDLQWYQKASTTWSAIDVLIIRSQTRVDSKLLENFPSLRLIVSATAGFNHIDLKLCRDKHILVCHCPDSHSASTAELTWNLVLTCCRKTIQAHHAIKKGDWDRQKIMGFELQNKIYGVVGLGRVGKRVARIASAFEMKVMAYDPYEEDDFFQTHSIERVSLEELLSQSDVISLHVPLTKETWHMMGEVFLSSLSPHAILVNTCRGPVVHERALIQCLRDGKIGAVGLDVFEYEPLPKDSPLLQFSNVITTPHIGASTREAFDKASQEAYSRVLEFYQLTKNSLSTPSNLDSYQSLTNQLPPKATWFDINNQPE